MKEKTPKKAAAKPATKPKATRTKTTNAPAPMLDGGGVFAVKDRVRLRGDVTHGPAGAVVEVLDARTMLHSGFTHRVLFEGTKSPTSVHASDLVRA